MISQPLRISTSDNLNYVNKYFNSPWKPSQPPSRGVFNIVNPLPKSLTILNSGKKLDTQINFERDKFISETRFLIPTNTQFENKYSNNLKIHQGEELAHV